MSAVLKPKTPTLGGSIDDLYALREQKRGMEAKIKEVEDKIHTAEANVMELMEAQGVDKSTGKLASASITKAISANIVDWEVFMKYVAKTKYFHLIQKRVSDPAARELFESKGNVPGLEPYTRKKLNLRTISS